MFIDNGLLIFGDVVSGFTEVIRVGIEGEKVVLDLEGDAEVLSEFAEDTQVLFGCAGGEGADFEGSGDGVEGGFINIDAENNFFGKLLVGFEGLVGEFDVGNFAEGSGVESLVKELLDFVEIFNLGLGRSGGFRFWAIGFGEEFFGEENAEVANPNGAGKAEVARKFRGDGWFAAAESGAVGDVVVDKSGSLEDFVGGGEI